MAALQVLEQLHSASRVVEGLLSSSSEGEFDQELNVINILFNLTSLGDKLSASSTGGTLDLQGWFTGFWSSGLCWKPTKHFP